MIVARLALALERAIEDRLMTPLLEAGHEVLARVVSAADIIECIPVVHPEIVLVMATRRHLDQPLITECDARGIRIVAFATSDLERRHAASLGLYEVLDASASWPEVHEVLTGGVRVPLRTDEFSRATRERPQGATIAVWGPAGSPGRTTLAINIAAELAAAGFSVVLADADTFSGSVAPALGMLDEAPGFAAACRLAGTDSLTIQELERVAQRYTSPGGSFHVLTGLGRPKRWPELSDERVSKALLGARNWADYVVVDTGFSLENDEEISSDLFAPRRNAATIASIREADRVVAVGVADPVGMSRFLRTHVDLLELMDGRPVSVVMNKVRSSALGPSPFSQVAATLKRFAAIDAPVLVPWDQHGVDRAMLAGRTLCDAVPKSPARQVIRRFVESVIISAPVPASPRRQRRAGRVGRLGPKRHGV